MTYHTFFNIVLVLYCVLGLGFLWRLHYQEIKQGYARSIPTPMLSVLTLIAIMVTAYHLTAEQWSIECWIRISYSCLHRNCFDRACSDRQEKPLIDVFAAVDTFVILVVILSLGALWHTYRSGPRTNNERFIVVTIASVIGIAAAVVLSISSEGCAPDDPVCSSRVSHHNTRWTQSSQSSSHFCGQSYSHFHVTCLSSWHGKQLTSRKYGGQNY